MYGPRPKGVIVICVRDSAEHPGYADALDYLQVYRGGEMTHCVDQFTGDSRWPHFGTRQNVNVEQAIERWPYMAEMIEAECRRHA
jgi:hypothetical protein